MNARLILEDGSTFEGFSYGAQTATAGEMVFSTGMVGYPESLTDPSYLGQILILTYPLIGNYGVPNKQYFESDGIKVSGLIVSNYIDTPSHFQSEGMLAAWCKNENVPLLEITDTRFLAQKIRDKGAMLGKIVFDNDLPFYDPNADNLVAKVSTKKIIVEEPHAGNGQKTVVFIDCGAKRNIRRSFLKRGVKVITVPWNFDPFDPPSSAGVKLVHTGGGLARHVRNGLVPFDGLVISNGPGDPKMADKTIEIIKKAIELKIPTLGICLGNQLLALAAGGNTSKLKFGHRSQNQPCIMTGSTRCFVTTQNHGFEISDIPKGFKAWFTNANDGSNEGLLHTKYPFMSVQFHPEATPGPMDTEWIFDYFLEKIR